MASEPLQRPLNDPETAGEGSPQGSREALKRRAEAAFAKAREVKAAVGPRKPRKRGFSTIEHDAEVADFLRERFRTGITMAQLRAACVERFGADRAPSQGRIGVFRQRARW